MLTRSQRTRLNEPENGWVSWWWIVLALVWFIRWWCGSAEMCSINEQDETLKQMIPACLSSKSMFHWLAFWNWALFWLAVEWVCRNGHIASMRGCIQSRLCPLTVGFNWNNYICLCPMTIPLGLLFPRTMHHSRVCVGIQQWMGDFCSWLLDSGFDFWCAFFSFSSVFRAHLISIYICIGHVSAVRGARYEVEHWAEQNSRRE